LLALRFSLDFRNDSRFPAPRRVDVRETARWIDGRAEGLPVGGIPPLSHWKGEGSGANFAA